MAGVGGGVGVGVTGSTCIDATGSGVGASLTVVDTLAVVGVFGRLLVLLVALRVGLIDFNFFGEGRGETSRLVRVVFFVTVVSDFGKPFSKKQKNVQIRRTRSFWRAMWLLMRTRARSSRSRPSWGNGRLELTTSNLFRMQPDAFRR